MRAWKGKWLIGVAAGHTLYAVVVFGRALADIAARGFYDTVGEDLMTAAVVWFVLFGAVLAIAGQAIDHIERAAACVPRSLGVSLLLLTVAGILLMPASGFWLVFPPIFALFLGGRRKAALAPS